MAIVILQIKKCLISREDKQRIADDISLQMGKGVVVLDSKLIDLLGVIGNDGVFVPCDKKDTQHYEGSIDGT